MTVSDKDKRELALCEILESHNLRSEQGLPLIDFENGGWDGADFCSVNRLTLRSLMREAFEAGIAAA